MERSSGVARSQGAKQGSMETESAGNEQKLNIVPAHCVVNPPAMQETSIDAWSEDALEEGMALHSRTCLDRNPMHRETWALCPMGLQRVGTQNETYYQRNLLLLFQS